MPRTITDIVPPSRRRPMGDPMLPQQDSGNFPPPPPQRPLYIRPRRKFPWGTAIVAIIVVILAVGALALFGSAKVDVFPTTNTGTVTGTYTATPSTGDIPFQLVTVQKVASESVPAESTVTANDAAQGTITIYNTQSKAQPLINNTRFETSAGLIFRIHQSVTVPAGSAVSPGTLNVTVYADSPGEEYNIGPSSFTLPGLSGTPQATQVYAKSTEAFTGGFSGTRPSVGQATDDAEHAKLQATLSGQMTGEVAPQVPDGYVLIPGSIFVTYVPLPDAGDTSGNVLVKEQATATAVIFPADAISRIVATQVVGQQYNGQPISLKDVSGLALAGTGSTTPAANSSFSFTLSGNATVVWKVDPTKIAGAVAGKSRASALSVLTGFPEVGRAVLTLRPFWKGSYPSDPGDITVTVETP
ncbi:MAG TPA: hypothetical protein VHC20_02665 [Candidatus Paceibacterota bacterium]|nr:hypothetical protein [Candidatus Paceibacterota bacterium]